MSYIIYVYMQQDLDSRIKSNTSYNASCFNLVDQDNLVVNFKY